MGRLSAWWRSGTGLLAACVLTVLTAGPGLDAMAHHSHRGVEPFAHTHPLADRALDHQHDHDADRDQGRAEADHGSSDHSGSRFHAHGLVHQAFSAAEEAPMVVATALMERQDYALAPQPIPISNRHFRLIRPPRA